MKTINNPVISFTLVLLAINVLVAAIHFFVINKLGFPVFENRIVLAYIVNVLHAICMYVSFYWVRKKPEANLGSVYVIGSMLKFGLFFLLFYPLYKADGNVETIEFTAFFIPYVVCLFVEIFYVVKLLNSIK